MDWDGLRHFAAFAEAGSLSGAARALGVEHATVARRIMSLETALGLKLVDRRGRRLTLTAEGKSVALLSGRMADTMGAIARLADGTRSDVRGEVTVSAPPAYAARVLAPRLIPLRARYPDLSVCLLGEGRSTSLERREADIAVRLSRPERGDLTAVRIGLMAFHLYASPSYLSRTPEAEWTFIGSAGAIAESAQQVAMARAAHRAASPFYSDSVDIQAALAASGGGIAALPDFVAEDRADLVRAGAGSELVTREIWLVVHSDMRNAAPVRAVMEALRADG